MTKPTIQRPWEATEEDFDAPIRLPRRGLNWYRIAGLGLMCAAAMITGFLMNLLWRLVVLAHGAMLH